VDLISKLLVFRPSGRLSATQALEHPYFIRFHNEEFEPTCLKGINVFLDDNRKFEVRKYREEIYKIIIKRNKEMRRQRIM